MQVINYEEIVRILSFNVQEIPRNAGHAPSNPPIDTTLATAIRLVCSDEWRDAGNVLAVILRDNGPPILNVQQARAMIRASDFPRAS